MATPIMSPSQQETLKPPPGARFYRKRTPTLIQMEAVECGAAALGIILRYFKKFVPLEELRVKCGVSRDGSKASHLINASKEYGLIAKGFRKEPAELFEIEAPYIVFWNFNHFLVVEGFGKNEVYLNDPAAGPRKVTYEEFDQSFTGIVLQFEPGPGFQPGGKPPSILKSALSRMEGSWLGLVFAILAGLILVVPGLIIPIFSKLFVDNILVSGMNNFLIPLLGGMFFTSIFRAGLTYLQTFYLIKMENKLSLSMSSKFFWHVLKLPYTFFTQRYAGDIANRIQVNDGIAATLSSDFASTTINLMMIVFYAALMVTYDPLLTTIGIGLAAINFVALKFVSRAKSDANSKLISESSKLMSTSMNGLFTIETLKASGTESDFFARWVGTQAKVANASQELSISMQIISTIPTMLNTINTAIILYMGGLRVADGQITLGTLVAFQSLMSSFLGPVNSFLSLGAKLHEIEGGFKRLDDVLDYKTEPDKEVNKPEHQPKEPKKLTGNIQFQNVTFGYNPLEPPLIEDFNLSVTPGSRVALVGGSGSGKSTVAKVLVGLFKPWSGKILFDGKERYEIPDNILTTSISMVDQEIFMFEGKIKENVAMWDPSLSEATIARATKDACIHDDIAARPSGYDAIVEEGGRNFSGGQRQRLEIARALVTSPSILVMDEATSALDPTTEKMIDENVRIRGCTCIIVAHRLSTIRDCDEIIVLEQGKVVERGTHEEMKDSGGPYSKLIGSSHG